VFRRVDVVTVPVPDLDTGLRFYAELLGHRVKWRNVVAYWTDLRETACFAGACRHGEDAYFAWVG
jgi:catechol 2,3-dioxygenase-like lactoylglutathione lyase family enzyme